MCWNLSCLFFFKDMAHYFPEWTNGHFVIVISHGKERKYNYAGVSLRLIAIKFILGSKFWSRGLMSAKTRNPLSLFFFFFFVWYQFTMIYQTRRDSAPQLWSKTAGDQSTFRRHVRKPWWQKAELLSVMFWDVWAAPLQPFSRGDSFQTKEQLLLTDFHHGLTYRHVTLG